MYVLHYAFPLEDDNCLLLCCFTILYQRLNKSVIIETNNQLQRKFMYIYIYTIILEFSHKSATTATQHKATCHWGRPWNAWTYDQTWLNQYLNQGRNKHNMCCSCSNMCLHFNLIPPKHKGALTTSGYMLVTPSQCRSSKTMAVARNFQNPSYIFEGSHIPKKNFHGVFRRGMQGDTPDISATSPRDMKGFDEVILSIWELSGMGSSSLLLGNS